MKIVIQCAGRKAKGAGKLTTPAGEDVLFVAHPPAQQSPGTQYCHPDALIPGEGITWREHLLQYNLAQDHTNPNALCPAALLYRPAVYKALIANYSWSNVFILSAGWGLIRSNFLTPDYNVTFSNQAETPSKRKKHDAFDDFNHLKTSALDNNETICFFGGKDYLDLYYKLTADIAARKIIYHSHTIQQQQPGYDYIAYRRFTNWHYSCVADFMRGDLANHA